MVRGGVGQSPVGRLRILCEVVLPSGRRRETTASSRPECSRMRVASSTSGSSTSSSRTTRPSMTHASPRSSAMRCLMGFPMSRPGRVSREGKREPKCFDDGSVGVGLGLAIGLRLRRLGVGVHNPGIMAAASASLCTWRAGSGGRSVGIRGKRHIPSPPPRRRRATAPSPRAGHTRAPPSRSNAPETLR